MAKKKVSGPSELPTDAMREGYLVDFISGKPVKDGPEEREAVQVFSRLLVEDYGYPKAKHPNPAPAPSEGSSKR